MKHTYKLLALATLLPAFLIAPAFAGDKKYNADQGPDSVDASSFPEAQKKRYKMFASKCSKCHTLARPINTDKSKGEWKQYVKRMMNKPDSGISPKQGKQIYKFLKFWQANKNK